ATSSPRSFASSTRPKSIPAVTPPPVTRLRSTTTRASTGSAPNRGRSSRTAQWDAALYPCSKPAAPRMREPLHTDVTYWVWAARAVRKSSTARSCMAAAVPKPPGTNRTSRSGGQSAKVVVGWMATPESDTIRSRVFHTRWVVACQDHVVCGPIRSSKVSPGYSTMPTCSGVCVCSICSLLSFLSRGYAEGTPLRLRSVERSLRSHLSSGLVLLHPLGDLALTGGRQGAGEQRLQCGL